MIRRRHDDKTKLGVVAALLISISSVIAEPEVDAKQLPRIKPTEPADALGTFKLVPGYKLELVAAEPLVVDPIAMAFDEKRRLFVVEMRGYSERRDEKLGRVRLLTDEDGDGKFDSSTIYAKDLAWPTAVIAWDGGVFVAATPDIYYFKDEDGDGAAEIKKTIFTGFGAGVERLNVQALVNNLKWGPDGRIHGATAGNGGRAYRVGDPDKKITELRGLDFSFDPVTLDFRAENGGGQYGLTFDRVGEKYVCSNSNHIQRIMYPRRYTGSPLKPARIGIAADGPAAEVFRLSKDEPWRVVRTRWRVAGKVKGPIEGGGRVSGYFTAATGIEIHRSNAFICDAGSNLVHRKQLLVTRESARTYASRPHGEEKVEFLASTDNWFRPVQLISGPDGALYVADMYREVIEHPWSLPPSIKKHLDLNSGNDRGRIYRVVENGFVQPEPVDLKSLGTAELVNRLGRPDHDLAAMVLRNRDDPEIVGVIEDYFGRASSPHALQLLHDLGALDEQLLVGALSGGAMEQALVLSESLDPLPEAAKRKMAALASNPSPKVRYQLALTLGLRDGEWRIPILAEIFTWPTDEWIEGAALKALGGSAGAVFEVVTNSGQDPPIDLVVSLAALIGYGEEAGEISAVREFADRSPRRRFQILAGLASGRSQWGEKWVSELSTEALKVAADKEVDLAERLGAVRIAGIADAYSVGYAQLFTNATAPEILEEIAKRLAFGNGEPQWARRIVERWDDFSPAGRVHAINALDGHERVQVLLEAIETGKIPASAVGGAMIDRFRKHADPKIRELAGKVFPESAGDRSVVFKKYWPALKLEGDAKAGEKIYQERCMICHRAGEQGFAYGPDIASFKSSGRQTVLENVIDPGKEVPPQYQLHEISLGDGTKISGKIVDQNREQVRLGFPAGVEREIERKKIEKIQELPNSPMPEGLEAGLSEQQMADLLEFLTGS